MKITDGGLEHNCYRESVFLNRMRFGSFIVIFWMAADRRLLGFPVLLCYFLLLHSAANETEYRRNCPETFNCGKLGPVEFPFTNNWSSECGLPISGCDDPDAEVRLGNQTYKIESINQDYHNSIVVHETGATINLWEFRETMSFHVVNRVAFFRCIHHFNDDKLPEDISLYTGCPHTDYGIYFSFDHDFPADRVKDTFPSLSTACSAGPDPSIPHDSSIPCAFLSSFVEIEVTLSKSCEEDYCVGSYVPAANYGNPGAPPPSSTDHNGQPWKAPKIGYPIKYPESFNCGKLRSVGFPFAYNTSSECGLPISGCDDLDAEVHLGNQTYKIASINREYHNSIFVHETGATINLWEFRETMSFHVVNRVAFFRCIHHFSDDKLPEDISLYTRCPHNDYGIYFSFDHDFPTDRVKDTFPSLSTACSAVPHPSMLQKSSIPCTFLSSFVEIEVTLSKSCEEDYRDGSVVLAAPPPSSTDHNGQDSKAPIIGLSVGLAAITVIALCQFCAILSLYKRRRSSSDYQNKARNIYSSSNSNTKLESRTVYFGIPVFPYEELQEATDNFDQARELGEGGFGTVYYGKLRDGREVAVKRLYERNYRPVESFINEIQILTRLRHKNLVSLYGCTSRHSRELLLVYEYVANGTVSYHLHGDKSKSGLLPWHVRMKIAIETANALAYLHASDIIHRDVKTSNILLDNNFSVKVADFGLSRLFPDDVTHISTAPRGTPGYVDPDYRLCYQLTSKSDVYSFGVVLVELISSLPAVDMNRDRDEIKLANLALRKIQKGAFVEVVDPNLGSQSDDKSRRMMISVAKLAFQCLQGDKDMRPSMCEVLEVLQGIESGKDEPGDLEGIEVHSAGVSLGNSHPLPPNTVVKPKRLHQTL